MKVRVAKALRAVPDDGGDFQFWISGPLQVRELRELVEAAVAGAPVDPNLLQVRTVSDDLTEVAADLKGDGEQATRLVAAVEAALAQLSGKGSMSLKATQPTVDLFADGTGPMHAQPAMQLTVVPPVPVSRRTTWGARPTSEVDAGTGVQPELAAAAVELLADGADSALIVDSKMRGIAVDPVKAPPLVSQPLADDQYASTGVILRRGGAVAIVRCTLSNIDIGTTLGDDPHSVVATLIDWVSGLQPLPWTACLVPGYQICDVGQLGETSAGEEWGTAVRQSRRGGLIEVGWFNVITPSLEHDDAFVAALKSLGSVVRRTGRLLYLGDLEDWLPTPNTDPYDEAYIRPLQPVPPSPTAARAREALAPFLARKQRHA